MSAFIFCRELCRVLDRRNTYFHGSPSIVFIAMVPWKTRQLAYNLGVHVVIATASLLEDILVHKNRLLHRAAYTSL